MNKKIIIPGGSGFIGQALVKYFGKENEILILGRMNGDQHKNLYGNKLITKDDGYNVRYIRWDGKNVDKGWSDEIDGADLIINLAGKSVNCRYHSKQKNEIINSRLNATHAIGAAIRNVVSKPKVWINVVSATIYKNSADRPNDENSGMISDWKKDNMPFNLIDYLRYKKNRLLARLIHGRNSVAYKEYDLDFSVQVCKLWEKSFFSEPTPGTRKIALRTAITLGKGGVMTPYLNLCKYGLGGKHGNGKQMFSWIHVDDVARMIEWLYNKENAEGIYNCASPNAVSNYQFMKMLRQATRHRLGLPAYSWMLEAGAFLIRTETELMVKSRWVIPAKASNEGFNFKYCHLQDALSSIVVAADR